MIVDLNYLNRFSKLNIDEKIELDNKFLENSEIRELKDINWSGIIEIDYEDNLVINLKITGTMVLPCAVTLVDVPYEFETEFDNIVGNFEEIYKNNKNTLDISDILWENIVLEIPIRVVSENSKPSNTSGDGWELISE